MYGHKDNDKEEIFIIGGGEIYRQAMELSNYLYLTRVHAWIAGDIEFPEVDSDIWEEVESKEHKADAKHKFGFTFLTYKKKDRLHL
jgi:dihydrofolate reductase